MRDGDDDIVWDDNIVWDGDGDIAIVWDIDEDILDSDAG